MTAPIAAPPTARSTFVTVLAWIFIGLSASNVLISLLQNVMSYLLLSGSEFEEAIETARAGQRAPEFAVLMMEYMHVFLALILLSSIAMLVASIGLLRRLDWARWLFIALIALGMLGNIAGFFAQFLMFPSVSDLPPGGPEEFERNFRAFFIGFVVLSGLMLLAFTALFGWIIKRLLSPAIAAEFARAQRPV